MATTVIEVYEQVCNVLLEDGALRLGFYDEQTFLVDLVVVIQDLLQRTGIAKKLYEDQIQSGTAQYTLDEEVVDVQAVFVNNQHIQPSSGFHLDYADREWASSSDFPECWHVDRIADGKLALSPTPDFTGAADSLKIIATKVPTSTTLTMADNIPSVVPDTMALYLKFGVLAKVFSTDGESKDIARHRYCVARMTECINLFKAVMLEEILEDPPVERTRISGRIR